MLSADRRTDHSSWRKVRVHTKKRLEHAHNRAHIKQAPSSRTINKRIAPESEHDEQYTRRHSISYYYSSNDTHTHVPLARRIFGGSLEVCCVYVSVCFFFSRAPCSNSGKFIRSASAYRKLLVHHFASVGQHWHCPRAKRVLLCAYVRRTQHKTLFVKIVWDILGPPMFAFSQPENPTIGMCIVDE